MKKDKRGVLKIGGKKALSQPKTPNAKSPKKTTGKGPRASKTTCLEGKEGTRKKKKFWVTGPAL